MKVLYSILIVAAATMIVPLLIFSSTDELVYTQQEENQTDFNDIQKEMNLTLGTPIYKEIFTVPKSDNNLSSLLTQVSIHPFLSLSIIH
jgi:hypothetical protein